MPVDAELEHDIRASIYLSAHPSVTHIAKQYWQRKRGGLHNPDQVFLPSLKHGRKPLSRIPIDVQAVYQAVVRDWRDPGARLKRLVRKLEGRSVEPVGQQHGPKVNVPVCGRGAVDYDGADDAIRVLEGEVRVVPRVAVLCCLPSVGVGVAWLSVGGSLLSHCTARGGGRGALGGEGGNVLTAIGH